ncbi:MAG: 50S ribosomal protein L17 [Candidatus Pacebacteria bacterium CG10_big_fil_rev_8_21_14_0_10_36_11]|nr:50S ribosomal protein L17 [Candidatus Pacearchaeota archaeon]OIP73681.1 MAG: 50S ribosomal protein L17 [Candidatus Pacebacteria bacterium CG2_30_36_39]PIR64737.1 MAG: 50S ribosomal protein L17 [Candidatus Pacebacteria bacterium CG10_big_fil_rev_8_21_14_0_10_36_11]
MRHRQKTKQLGRDTKHRKALLRNLVRALIEQGEIVTSEAKAKETKRWADKLIGKAKTDSLATRRLLHTFFGKRDVVNTLVERIAPAMKDRISGFSSIEKLGTRRGDNADVVKLSLVEATAKKVGLKAPKAEKTEKKEVKVAKKPAAKKTVKKAE